MYSDSYLFCIEEASPESKENYWESFMDEENEKRQTLYEPARMAPSKNTQSCFNFSFNSKKWSEMGERMTSIKDSEQRYSTLNTNSAVLNRESSLNDKSNTPEGFELGQMNHKFSSSTDINSKCHQS